MTNRELAAKCKDIALNYKTVYVLGGFGAPMTAAYKQQCVKNYSYNNRSSTWNATADTFAFDCIGIIKGLCWDFSGNLNATYGGAKYASNGVPDVGANMTISLCSDVTEDFSEIEIGEAVWLDGHIGVYIGDGLAVECTPAWENKVQITAVGNIGAKTGYNTRTWTKHGKLPWIDYNAKETPKTDKKDDFMSLFGIDVSRWNGDIDWSKVKESGVKFAMLRLGYGSTDGNDFGTDRKFMDYVSGAVAAGVNIGCYFYSYALTPEAARKEAEYTVSVLENVGDVFTYPIAFDLEDDTQVGLSKRTHTDMVIAFCDVIRNAGYYPMLYTNLNWLSNYLYVDELKDIDIWLAQWASEPSYSGDFGMWQNSATGRIDGIDGNVDTDYCYRDYPNIIKNGSKTVQSGDVNGDGKITAADARMALRCAVNLETLTPEQMDAADMNNDGKITASDARDILRRSVGLDE